MAKTTIGLGVALILLGLIFMSITTHAPTALIPAYVGILFIVLGWIGLKDRLRKHAMHAAAALALLGVAATFTGLINLTKLLTGQTIPRPLAAIEQSIMAALCLLFLALSIRSFIEARRRRT